MENKRKITRKHSVGSIFSFFICLILSSTFLLSFIVLPWLEIGKGAGAGKIMGLDFIFHMIPVLEEKPTFLALFNHVKEISNATSDPNLMTFYRVAIIILPCLYVFSLAWVIYFFCIAWVYLFAGRTSSRNAPVGMALFHVIFTVLTSGSSIALSVILNKLEDKAIAAQTAAGVEVTITKLFYNYTWAIVFVAISVIGFVVLAVIKHTTYGRKRIWWEDAAYEQYITSQVVNGVNANPYGIPQVPAYGYGYGYGYPAYGMPPQPYPANGNMDPNLAQPANPNVLTRIEYKTASGLPANIRRIGGHAFSENLNLITAVIPQGIDRLGDGAFANCGALRIISIPTSVKYIGANCFFNCASVQRINYSGTKEQWRHIVRGSNWLLKAGTNVVVCTDGSILVNPVH